MQDADMVINQGDRQRFGIGGNFLGRQPERGADQIADPDFLERHVESHRKPLIYAVFFTNTEHSIFATQEMADSTLINQDTFRLAG